MKITPTPIEGVMLVQPTRISDERGHFARSYCLQHFADANIAFQPVQESISYNHTRHTLRGMHVQKAPAQEQKLVRCTRGRVFDVALDLRRDSATHGTWFAAELSEENGHALFLPRGVAHGFLTLSDQAELLYLIDAPYAPALACGVRWNDPAFAINWPHAPALIAPKDQQWTDYGA